MKAPIDMILDSHIEDHSTKAVPYIDRRELKAQLSKAMQELIIPFTGATAGAEIVLPEGMRPAVIEVLGDDDSTTFVRQADNSYDKVGDSTVAISEDVVTITAVVGDASNGSRGYVRISPA